MSVQNFSYHTHTNFSDGKNSLEEMLEQAVKLGWKEIGISDHLQIHKNISQAPKHERFKHFRKTDFDSSVPFFQEQIEKVRKVAKQYPIKTYVGFEVDYFSYPGWEDSFRSLVKQLDVDYLIMGSHFCFEDGDSLIGFNDVKEPEQARRHFQNIKKAIESKLFDVIAHLDYVSIYQAVNTKDFKSEIFDIIKAMKKHNVATELNTNGYNKGEQFPASWILEELCRQDIPIIISDDAHTPARLGEHFERAEGLLKDLNYTNRWKL